MCEFGDLPLAGWDLPWNPVEVMALPGDAQGCERVSLDSP